MDKRYDKLGAKIRKERIRLRMTQTEFASLIGREITKQKASRLENGQNLPDVFELFKIAAICGKPMEYFVADDDLEEPEVSATNKVANSIYSEDELRLINKIKAMSAEKRSAIELLLGITKAKK